MTSLECAQFLSKSSWYWEDHEFLSEECLCVFSKWNICISQYPDKVVDALTHIQELRATVCEKSALPSWFQCMKPVCSSELLSLTRVLTIPFFDLLINLRLVLQFDHILSAQTQTSIFSSLLFQKKSSMTLSAQTRVPFVDSKYSFYSKRVLERVWDVQFSKYPWLINLSTWFARSQSTVEYQISFLYMQRVGA